ncbi:MAG TPA: PfkB family carbohydrate kinase, partial [Pirellulales bacterium]|nr:PfkB family carbohydrate kinase [Pirellulales bacterium]
GIAVAAVSVTGGFPVVVDAQGENAIAVASGANAELRPDDIDALPQSLFDGARVLLTCLETPLDTVARALTRAKQAGLLTILNPAPVGSFCDRLELLELVNVLTPNQLEAAELTGSDLSKTDSLAMLGHLRRLGAGQCVLTLGADGCLVVSDRVETIPAVPVTAIDTTAAGDAFNGVLAVALAEGRALVEAARWANRAAALAVTRRGAQPSLPQRHEIEA